MATWADLDAECAQWRAAGETPTLWWRDDDTQEPSAALDRLIGLSDQYVAPLHLAVVPANISPNLKPRLSRAKSVFTLQHGFAHINHEPKGLRASEVGDSRDLSAQIADLQDGWSRLKAADLPNLLPAFAPPWNRIAEKTVAHMPALGYRLLSRFDVRSAAEAAPGLAQVNIHVDPIRWKEGARFRGEEVILHHLIEHLELRRTGRADKAEPTGLSTHHLQTDAITWDFLDALFDRLAVLKVRWTPLTAYIPGSFHG